MGARALHANGFRCPRARAPALPELVVLRAAAGEGARAPRIGSCSAARGRGRPRSQDRVVFRCPRARAPRSQDRVVFRCPRARAPALPELVVLRAAPGEGARASGALRPNR
jgi:hypothetical protein